MLVVGVVALIVVGPKDLPILFRKVGQFVGKAKGMAREFSNAMNDAADDTGMREISSGLNKSLKAATNPLGSAMDGVKSATKSLTDIDPNSETGKMAAKRAEDVKKIQAATARAGAERKQREAAEALAHAEAAEAKLTTGTPQIEASPATEPNAEPTAKTSPVKKPPAARKAAAPKAASVSKAALKRHLPRNPPRVKPQPRKPQPRSQRPKRVTHECFGRY